MRKIFSLFAALTLSVGLWAETVSYLYPVYNEGGATKGIKEWKTTTVEATPITSSSSTWGAVDQETWLVVNGNVTISQRVTCKGDVHLILANDVTLNATQGIAVSGESNSLTIYAQSTGDEMGQLIANGGANAAGIGGGANGSGSYITINGGEVTATGGGSGAGIGGGTNGSGSYITINGGEVTATSGGSGAGIGGGNGEPGSNITINGGEVTATGGSSAAGIGGGSWGAGSNITILAGTVTATGGTMAAGIGGGKSGTGSNIFVATDLLVKADGNNPPTTVITNTGADLASSLAGKQYATIEIDIPSIKAAAIAAVNAEIAETDNDNVKAIATDAATAINAATTVAEINALKTLAIANIASAKAAYGEAYTAGETAGDAAGYARAKAELPTEGTTGPAVTITKGDKTVIFYNTDKVEYSIVDAD